MLEDQVAFLLQKYLGNYVRGLNKEALKISVWRGDVELTNMQLRPEALNSLNLPVRVKAGFLGSVRIKVPWSRLGQEPVLVNLDRILILAEPATQVKGSSEDAIQEAKRLRVRELEMRLLESQQLLKSEMNTSWLGSLINTIIGNLKLSISNIHIRYEDLESNPGHPFAAGVALSRLSAVTIDDFGKETFATGGALARLNKSVELERLAIYLDSDIFPWKVEKPWEVLLPSEWSQIFEFGGDKSPDALWKGHSYILQPVTGNAKYTKLRSDESRKTGEALQKAAVSLDNVTLCLSKDMYRDILKLADNFAAFKQRLKYAHFRPSVPVKANPRSWWKYACRAVIDEMKKASGKLSWEQVLRYARLRKKYLSLYASLLKSDVNRVVDDNKEIEKLDRELDIEVILQWRMLAHKFVEQSAESDLYRKKKEKSSWWSFGWTGSGKDEEDLKGFSEEDWEQLNRIIGYKEGSNELLSIAQDKGDLLHFFVEVHMKHNASRLITSGQDFLADLSCEGLDCSVKYYLEAKVFNFKLGSYRLSSPNGLLAESATASDSLVGVFSYKPYDANVDWSFVAKASPCYMTYLKDSIDQIIGFFKRNTGISQTLALETAAAVQMTIDGVKRTAQKQVARALKDQSRFFVDLDIAAPKITIPTKFCPDNSHATRLLLDLGNLLLCTKESWEDDTSEEEKELYLQFSLVLSDVSAFLADGDYHWARLGPDMDNGHSNNNNVLPVVEKCGVVLKLQQIQVENPFYPSTRLAVRLPSLGFHFSPARYHRLMQVAKVFMEAEDESAEELHPWNEADFEGWLSLLTWKGVGNREAVWQRRYFCLVGPYVYILENPFSKSYRQYFSLRGKQVHQVSSELTGGLEHVLVLCDVGQYLNPKVVEDKNTSIIRCDDDESRRNWQNRLQGAIYRASGSAAITGLSESSSPTDVPKSKSLSNNMIMDLVDMEKLFLTGVLDELRISFSCNYQSNQSFRNVLLGKESPLFEFRALGGQVELSMKSDNILIGTVLKTLEIEDQFQHGVMGRQQYLARSFIKDTEAAPSNASTTLLDVCQRNVSSHELKQTEGEDRFFEASDDLNDLTDSPMQRHMSEDFSAESSFRARKSSLRPPKFSRRAGLIPDPHLQARSMTFEEMNNTLDSFVKAQIIIYSQDSRLYGSLDTWVLITLATLSFFCHRPTILAIMEFVDAISFGEGNNGTKEYVDESSGAMTNLSNTDLSDKQDPANVEEAAVKGLLGKGKSRVIFDLTLNMARALIFLMNEDGSSLATLSQNNLLTDIKVFPSSFSIKASLGNLKIRDDSLPSSHPYFWVCDMRNPGGTSFVELDFSSFNVGDEDYDGYDYSLIGQLSEVRIVYLNRFIQEVVSYFMGLVPANTVNVVKLKDHVTNAEKWFTTSEIDGSPAVKLDLALKNPIIVLPRRTDSLDYLELDVLHITVQNTFQWLGGDKNVMSALHLEILTIKVEDINLTIGIGKTSGESIIPDVKGLSVTIQRSLRDLLHQVPAIETAIKVEGLKAALSNREYQILTECALSNISETPRVVPSLDKAAAASPDAIMEPPLSAASSSIESEPQGKETWITMKVSVAIHFVELSIHSGPTRDSPLASMQASGAWLLYKSNACGDGFLFATLKGFSIMDDREGTKQEFRLAVGKSGNIGSTYFRYDFDDSARYLIDSREIKAQTDPQTTPSMLILDAKFEKTLMNVSLCIQRPMLLVALDFMLAIVEFFVPSVRSMLSNEEGDPPNVVGAIILDQPVFLQPSLEFTLSPQKPLIMDDETFDHFIYDGKGGRLYLQNREGRNLSSASYEPVIYVGSGKRLQFKNVTFMNGEFLDSSIYLGSNSSYSTSEDDCVFFESSIEESVLNAGEESREGRSVPDVAADGSTEFIIELQAIGPDLTFYNTSKDIGESLIFSTKVMHAHLDLFSRLVLKGDSMEMSGSVLGFKVESNGIRVLEPFDTIVKFSNAAGKINVHLTVSDIFMNFTFSILRLFLAVEEDIVAFLRMTSKKATAICSEFDKVGTVQDHLKDQTYAFWRPRAPSGFAVLGDCLTPLNEPPAKGVLAVNSSFVRVKRPVSFKLIWSSYSSTTSTNASTSNLLGSTEESSCSVWFPVAPKDYVAVGCVVSAGRKEPPLSSALCILSSLVSHSTLKDCIALTLTERYSASVAFWRVENSFGSFLPAKLSDMSLIGKAYEFRHMLFGNLDSSMVFSVNTSKSSSAENKSLIQGRASELERSAVFSSGRLFEAVASFRLIWWNQGTTSRKKLSIWRPVLPQGMVYLGDVAIQGYEPPNSAIVLHDTDDESFLRAPQDFQLVGHIKKQKGIESISFWLPHAPPGFVALGCVASKGSPKHDDFSLLRCIRSDMVAGDQFPEESIWDSSETKVSNEPFSLWSVGNEAGTFLVRSGFKKPPKRFALKLAGSNGYSGSDNTVIDAQIKTFSVAFFDDYGGLMVPLFNVSFDSIGFGLHGSSDYLKSTVNFSLAVRSYNDKYDCWEPLVEPMDGFLRYQYDLNAPGAPTQLRMTSTRDLNLNISVSNANLMIQAYSSWNSLSHIQESYKKREAISPTLERAVVDIHERKNYYIITQNKLGQDIYVRATEMNRISNIIKMPSGDDKPLKVPVLKNMLNAHMKGSLGMPRRSMVTLIIADAELPAIERLTTGPYTVAVRLYLSHPSDTPLQQQSARTSGATYQHSSTSGTALVSWREVFFFKVDFLDDYMVEFVVIDVGIGAPVGFYSAPLKQIAYELKPDSGSYDPVEVLNWRELLKPRTMGHDSDAHEKWSGRLRCAVLLSIRTEIETDKKDIARSRHGFIQISPTREGPWTTVRLNYAAPAACWRLGNDVIASEVSVRDGNRYVSMRSLVCVTNNTDFAIDLLLKPKGFSENLGSEESGHIKTETDEFFEVQKYTPSAGWTDYSTYKLFTVPSEEMQRGKESQGFLNADLPDGWEWTDDWHVDETSEYAADGWVYVPDVEQLKWPETSVYSNASNSARQRRWIRHRKCVSCPEKNQIVIDLVKPGHTVSLPLSVLAHPVLSYILQLRPKNNNDRNTYDWSVVLAKYVPNEVSSAPEESPEICVSNLAESDELLYCSQIDGTSSEGTRGLWFCLSVKGAEIGKDIHADPIHDWNLTINAPLSITNFLPLPAEYAITDEQSNGVSITCSQSVFGPGENVKVYNADLRDPLYLSIRPCGGWQAIHEPVPISHPSKMPSKIISLRSSYSGRIVQLILDQNFDKGNLISRVVRIYVPYWIATSRCPPLIYRLIDLSGRRTEKRPLPVPFHSNQRTEMKFWQIGQEELVEGYTIASALNFKLLGLSASLSRPGKERFGPIRELSPLGDMDGSIDLYAYDTEGNCFRIFVSSKPSPYQAVPTKVISVCPFVTFTNRVGANIYIKLNSGDEPKILHASDARVSFISREAEEEDKLQVRLENSDWCFPVEIVKEDTLTIVLRRHQGGRRFLKAHVRGYDEGSRFLVVIRPESANGPIRIENRMNARRMKIRQFGLRDDAWIVLEPHSTTNFSWDDPHGQPLLEVCVSSGSDCYVLNVNLENVADCAPMLMENHIELNVLEVGDLKIARFSDARTSNSGSHGKREATVLNSSLQNEVQSSIAPLEIIIELGIVGVSLIDHKPRELLYLHFEKLFISYSTGYDAGTTSRFKVIVGHLQFDNQLALTVMPVLLVPEDMPDINHPVFKTTITMKNDSTDGIQVYPYVYIRVTEKCWRLNIHEPIIWALMDFYDNLRTDNISSSSSISQVDPEIRIDLIDVSEVRLKISLETAPAQRPHGVLGIWSPIFSAVGNAFKIQVHLRKVMHRSRFMRKSNIIPAISNRLWRDLVHNPLHLIFSVDVLGMTKSTLSSLSKGFAELSTDGQFLQLRSKQVWSRKITGVSDGLLQGTEALAQGFAFGVSGVLTKPIESARQHGLLGFAHGLGRAFLGFVVQPLSGALDFVSLTVDGIGASFARCVEILNNKAIAQRIRNPRAIHSDGILGEYSEREAAGQMVLYLAEASRHLGCTDLFKEPSKYAWSDYYEDHFIMPYQRIVLLTNKRVMLLQCPDLDKVDKKPSKIIWDVPWDEILALELAKGGYQKPSYLIIHLKNFRRSESFVRIIKCNVEESNEQDPQAVKVSSSIRKLWRAYQSNMKILTLKVPSSQRYVHFACDEVDGRDSYHRFKPMIKPRGFSSVSSFSDSSRFLKHTVNFQKIWSSEHECKDRCTLLPKQVLDDGAICSVWRPLCPDGYVSIGDVAHVGIHPPNVAAIYHASAENFVPPLGYDLVWRNCPDDYAASVSLWLPRPPDGFVAAGCVAVAAYEEPPLDLVFCVSARIAEETRFEEQMVWASPDSYPWACYIYQVQSETLSFVALRQRKEESDWRPMRVSDRESSRVSELSEDGR